ncbi:DUF6233 domain-containing protein [Streptomyces africanus]|uniref:DUF6233 domain-containing protein n=1 Tax=Streptomyces africanus TaxID=231024 RepID=UPI000A3AC7CC|nr:DUF6233 domain-containing protein [Streptomyces africanus]
MNDLPPDLPRLRTLETWLILTLDRVRRQIADAERREEELQRGIAARPPVPDWLIERGLSGRGAVYVHVGGCWNAGKRSKGVTQEQALHALAEGVKPCPQCEPDNALGFLD